jgi:hypothetical protein
MYGPFKYLCVAFMVYQDTQAAMATQKKIFVLLCDYRSKTKEMDNCPVRIGVKFVAR